MLTNENNIVNDILTGCSILFRKYGIKSVTMDDIARHLAISKKTLYQYFDDKDKLVCSTIEFSLKNDRCIFDTIGQKNHDFVAELIDMSEYMKNELCTINPSLMFDLKKYHPKAYKIFNDFKHQFMVGCISQSLEKGKNQGYFRDDIDVMVFARIRMEQVELILDNEIFSEKQYDVAKIHFQMFQHFILGLCTTKGFEKLSQLLIKKEN